MPKTNLGGGLPPTIAAFCPSQDARGTALGTNKCCVISYLRDLSQNFAKKNQTTFFWACPSQCGRACPTVPGQIRLLEAACRRQSPPFVPAKTPVGQPLGQISDVLSITYTICPRISQKKIRPHFPFSILRFQFSLEAARRRLLVACFARSDVFLRRVTVGHGCVFCNTWGSLTHEPRPHCNAASRKNDRASTDARIEATFGLRPSICGEACFTVGQSLLNSRRLSLRTTAAEPQKVE